MTFTTLMVKTRAGDTGHRIVARTFPMARQTTCMGLVTCRCIAQLRKMLADESADHRSTAVVVVCGHMAGHVTAVARPLLDHRMNTTRGLRGGSSSATQTAL